MSMVNQDLRQLSIIHYSLLRFYSVRNDFTGFAIAAFIAWKLIVTKAITAARIPAVINIHHGIGYGKQNPLATYS